MVASAFEWPSHQKGWIEGGNSGGSLICYAGINPPGDKESMDQVGASAKPEEKIGETHKGVRLAESGG